MRGDSRRRIIKYSFYLPQGKWFEYASGKPVQGGTEIAITPDSKTWQDIPVYVREGSIVAIQPAAVGNDLNPATPLVLDVFPSSVRIARFLAYDDDGHTYKYEKGEYFRQEIAAKVSGSSTDIALDSATGTYKAHFPSYLLQVHQASGSVVGDGTKLKRFTSGSAFRSSAEPGWFSTTDRFGPVTEVRIPSDARQHTVTLALR